MASRLEATAIKSLPCAATQPFWLKTPELSATLDTMSDLGLFTVVGGADRGGIIVRSDRELGSDAVARLATGAVVKGLECHEGRMLYELVQGNGPTKGWVTMNLRGKDLLVKATNYPCEESTTEGSATESDRDSPKAQVEAEVEAQVQESDEQSEKITADEGEALRQYESKFNQARDGIHAGYNRKSFPWAMPQKVVKETSEDVIKAAEAFKEKRQSQRKARYWDVDSDGEEVTLCPRCFMPIGESAYEGKQKSTFVHPECMAQVMIEEMQGQEAEFLKEQKEKKLKNRQEHDIGWNPSTVPSSSSLAQRFGLKAAGLTCLVWDEASRNVRVAATLEPAAAVNLEYLVLALKVRRQERREPLFSLDPVDPANMETTTQKKRYEPEWLAGTSVGDVMFQADYFLKELALGEYTMPVVGMLSVFDWSEALNLHHQPWAGREWFVVKKAQVQMAEDKTLIPLVKMGVEAREQVLTANGLQDTPITSASHPLRRFADAFTRNFDLIAERKSVIFHLRELAKASVMAKFLVDSGACLDELWKTIGEEILADTAPELHTEIPQLWNMRGLSRIRLENGKIVDNETGSVSNLHAIYGGVEFGLDRFELAQRHALRPGVPGMAMQQAGLQGMQLGPSGRPMFMPQRFQLTQRGEMPQGVDLDLDKFNLEVDQCGWAACSGGPDSLEARTHLGKAFLKGLREGYDSIKDDDKEVLQGIFKAALADRTGEGDIFIPPNPNASYISKLRNLVNEEKALLKKRKLAFCDRSFLPSHAGPEFPRSWTSGFKLENGFSPAVLMKLKSALVQLQVDSNFQQTLLDEVLPVAAPEFQKSTEDGIIFRIYRLGSLEVRTIQEPEGQEEVGVVFSTRAPTWDLSASKSSGKAIRDDEKVVRGRIYVEAIDIETARRLDQKWSSKRLDYCHHYVVLETEEENVIVTEKFPDGTTMMVVNPEGVEDRNSLAKLLATAEDCKDMDVAVGKVKLLQINHHRKDPEGASPSLRKRYAKAVFCMLRRQVRKTKGLDRRPYTSRKQVVDK